MKKGMVFKAFVYLLSVSLLLMMNGLLGAIAQATEKGFPIGEMILRGEVKFEARENVWKKVETSYIPIFQGTKIETQKGQAIISLMNKSQIEMGEHSLLSFDQNDVLHLFKGQVNFRIPVDGETHFKIGHLFITKSLPLKVSRNPSMTAPKNEDFVGSLSIHSNGSITVKSIQGALSIVSQDHVVIASLSSKDTVTIPSITVKSPDRRMVAQAGDTTAEENEKKTDTFLGISTWGWVGIGGGVAAVVAIVAVTAGGGGGGGGHGAIPICR
jgi:hypothetical protein